MALYQFDFTLKDPYPQDATGRTWKWRGQTFGFDLGKASRTLSIRGIDARHEKAAYPIARQLAEDILKDLCTEQHFCTAVLPGYRCKNLTTEESGQVIQPEALVLEIRLLGFHHYATNFLSAARSVAVDTKFSPVPYYLRCRAIELVLKAFLLARKVPVDELIDRKKLGHNLKKVLTRAKQLDLAQHVTLFPQDERSLQEVWKKSLAAIRSGAMTVFFSVTLPTTPWLLASPSYQTPR